MPHPIELAIWPIPSEEIYFIFKFSSVELGYPSPHPCPGKLHLRRKGCTVSTNWHRLRSLLNESIYLHCSFMCQKLFTCMPTRRHHTIDNAQRLLPTPGCISNRENTRQWGDNGSSNKDTSWKKERKRKGEKDVDMRAMGGAYTPPHSALLNSL